MDSHARALCVAAAALAVAISAHAAQPRSAIAVAKEIALPLPAGWAVAPHPPANAVVMIAREQALHARVVVTTERRKSHAEAVARLARIARGHEGATTKYEVVSGWPEVERRYLVPLQEPEAARGAAKRAEREVLVPRVTIAVAVGNTIVRMDGTLSARAESKLLDQVVAAARTFKLTATGKPDEARRAVESLRKQPKPAPKKYAPHGENRKPPPPAKHPRDKGAPKSAALLVSSFGGELEVATSASGQTVVVAGQRGSFTSSDFGKTFSAQAGIPFFNKTTWKAFGDPSLAVGATGTFYAAWIGTPLGAAGAGKNNNGCATEINTSPSGTGFSFKSHAMFCPLNGVNVGQVDFANYFFTCFPDQEHIAADPKNKAGGKDQVYSVFRNFTALGIGAPVLCNSNFNANPDPYLVCSKDGGATWSAPVQAGSGDHGHVNVGSDGFVYVTYRDGDSLMVNKFSSCAAGLQQQDNFPQEIVDDINDPSCPIPGIDRCDSDLSSGTLAVDPDFPAHLVAAYASNTSSANDDVLFHESWDGGQSWSGALRINAKVNGRRFLPWVCAGSGGQSYVGWYDRRAATAAKDDLTDYFVGVALDGSMRSDGMGPEFKLTTSPDPECSTWPASPRSSNDATSCSTAQPTAGACSGDPTGAARCNFANDTCGARGLGSCSTGGGLPKYGDYNGFACTNGRFYAAFASATAQSGAAAPSGIQIFTSTLQPGTLSVTLANKVLASAASKKNKLQDDAGVPAWFAVTIDNNLRARDVGSGTVVGAAILAAGKHKVGIGTTHSFWGGITTTFGGDCAADGTVQIANGQHKNCVVTNTISSKTTCTSACQTERDDCMKSVGGGGGGHPLGKDCAQQFNQCRNRCQ